MDRICCGPEENIPEARDLSSRGILIAIEGIDGTGKTTQVALLANVLRQAGQDVVTSREPTDGYWGRKIKESATNGRLSPEEELDAFIRDRTEHVTNLIQPALDAGKIVILDRYYYSSIAYQGSRGANVEAVKATMETRFPIPDMVFLLDIDPALSLHRIAKSRNERPNQFEQLEGLAKAREVFHSLVGERVKKIDGALPVPEVQQRILELFIEGPLKAKRSGEWWNLSRALRTTLKAGSQL